MGNLIFFFLIFQSLDVVVSFSLSLFRKGSGKTSEESVFF